MSLELQLNSVFNLVEKSQQLSADFTLLSNWTDLRFTRAQAFALNHAHGRMCITQQTCSLSSTYCSRLSIDMRQIQRMT